MSAPPPTTDVWLRTQRTDASGQYPTFTYCDLQASPPRVAPFQVSARQIQATVLMAKARSLRQAGLSQTVYHFGEKVWPQVWNYRLEGRNSERGIKLPQTRHRVLRLLLST